MKLDSPQPHQPASAAAHDRAKPAPASMPPADSPIVSLSAASDAFAHSPARGTRSARPPSLILAVIAGLIVGTAVALTGQLENICVATFQVADPTRTGGHINALRRSLTDYAARNLGGYSELTAQCRWFIEPDGISGLRLGLVASNRDGGLQQVRRLAQGFLASLAESAERSARTPTEAEKTLSDMVERRRREVAATMSEAQRALSEVPDDPKHARDEVLNLWEELRNTFRAKRKASAQALAALRRLETEPEPSAGIVANDERRAAWQQDPGLQQDLSELALRLSELKLQLLNAWQDSAGPLDRLRRETKALQTVLASAADEPGLADVRSQLTELSERTAGYRGALAAFTDEWTAEFKLLEAIDIDPHGGEVLDIYQRARRRLADFLFKSEKQLEAIRTAIRALGELHMDEARYHVFQAALARAYHSVHGAHQRFEFAASGIDPKNNFRLDTSLTGALGLRKRSRAKIRSIEDRLESAALTRARKRRISEIAESRHAVDHLRAAVDEAVEQLIVIQDELNARAGDSAQFLIARDRARLTEDRLERLRGDLTELEARLTALQQARLAAAEKPNVELVSCEALDRPINLEQRVQVGALAAALTLLTVFLGQCWVARGR